MKEGTILVLIGPPGAGKNTLTDILVERTTFGLYPSGTTREMRQGESQFYPYTFYSMEAYEALRGRGRLFNDIVVGNDHYFLQMDVFEEATQGGMIVLHLVYEWAIKLKQHYTNTKLVLVMPPDETIQWGRLMGRELRGRTSDNEIRQAVKNIDRRMADPSQKPPPDGDYDVVIVNQTGLQDEAAERLLEFLGSA